MPELPEIETILRTLEPVVKSAVIESVWIGQKELRSKFDRGAFAKFAVGAAVTALQRRGKYLVWHLSNNAKIIFHLGMSGRLGIYPLESSVERHTHMILTITGNRQIHYRDPRRFGSIVLLKPDERLELFLGHLGPEPLSKSFNKRYLLKAASRSKRAIKQFIMDPGVVAGVGNIYANEALYEAGVAPHRIVSSINKDEAGRIVSSVQEVLRTAIKMGGTTLKDYRNAYGEPGFFQQKLAVYGRKGQPCYRCGAVILKTRMGQRSSYMCPHCQK